MVLLFVVLFALSVSSAIAIDWTSFNVFDGMTPPYAANGPGCWSANQPPSGMPQPGTNCPDGNNPVYDTGAVWADLSTDYVAWMIMAPNMTDIQLCGGTQNATNSGWGLAIEFDVDQNKSSGADNSKGYPGYPGADYQLWVYGDGSTDFKFFNASYPGCEINSGVGNQSGYCFQSYPAALQATIYNIIFNVSCGPNPSKIFIAINRTAVASRLLGLDFETNTFIAPDYRGPVDMLRGSDGVLKAGPVDFMFDDEHPCFGYDQTNETACTTNSESIAGADSCVWNSFEQICDPDFSTMGCSEFCGSCNSTSSCESGSKGKCMVVDAPPNLPPEAQANIWTDGGNKFCVDDFSKVEMGVGGKCDDDCHFCYSQSTCQDSDYPNPMGSGNGCKWVNDTALGNSFCELVTFDETSLSCGAASLDRCFTQASCTGAGGNWSSALHLCYTYDNTTEYICFDGVDNDGDGLIDCQDTADCSSNPFCGGDIDVLTGGFGTLNPYVAMKQDMFSDMKEGPVIELAGEPPEAGVDPVLDAIGFGMKDMGKTLGIGIMLENISDSYLCGGANASQYFYYIDTDANKSSGCDINISGTVLTGFEYSFTYEIKNNGTGGPLEIRKGYRCVNNNFSLYPAKMMAPPPMPGDNRPVSCSSDAAIMAIDKTNIGSPQDNMRFVVATADNKTTVDRANDSILGPDNDGIYFTTGSVEFEPKDCYDNPMSCGTAFSVVGGGNFMPFEDCFPGSGDEDLDGLSNCDDPDCQMAPWCAGVFNVSADKTAPTVFSARAEPYNDFVFMHWTTNEPTNATLLFLNSCASGNPTHTFYDLGDPTFSFDDYRPWHDLGIGNNDSDSLGSPITLSPNTTYLYKIKNCDKAGNCGTSACLNFTTLDAAQPVPFQFSFSPSSNSLVNTTTIQLWNGTAYENITFNNASNRSNRLTDAKIKFENTDANWEIEFEGVDFAKTLDFNLSTAFNVTNQSGSTYVGIGNQDWLDMAQNMGVSAILIKLPGTGTVLTKCDENNLSNCQDVTGQATLNDSNSTEGWVKWKIPTSLGFSTYTVGGSGEVYNLTFINDSRLSVTTTGGALANYNVTIVNNDNTLRAYNLTVHFLGTSGTAALNSTVANLTALANTTVSINISASIGATYTWELIATLHNSSAVVLNSTDDIGVFTYITTDSNAPDTITGLTNASRTNSSLYWTWTNPGDADFNNTLVNVTNSSGNTVLYTALNSSTAAYNATNLTQFTPYTLIILTKDTSGNINSTAVSTTRMTERSPTAPSVTWVYPDGGENVSGSIDLNATVTDLNGNTTVSAVYFYVSTDSGSTWTLVGADSTTTDVYYNVSYDTTNGSDATTYRFRANATDASGLTSTTDTSAADLTVDNTAPSAASAAVTVESGAVYTTNSTLEFNWSGFTDATSGIRYYYYNTTDYAGSTNGTAVASTASTGSITVSSDGTYTVYVWAADHAGNSGSAVNDSIILDTSAPTITYVSPKNGWSVSDTTPNIQFTLLEAGIGLNTSSVQVTVNSTVYNWTDLTCSLASSTYTCNVTTGTLDTADIFVNITASDNLSQKAASSIVFSINTNAPYYDLSSTAATSATLTGSIAGPYTFNATRPATAANITSANSGYFAINDTDVNATVSGSAVNLTGPESNATVTYGAVSLGGPAANATKTYGALSFNATGINASLTGNALSQLTGPGQNATNTTMNALAFVSDGINASLTGGSVSLSGPAANATATYGALSFNSTAQNATWPGSAVSLSGSAANATNSSYGAVGFVSTATNATVTGSALNLSGP
ncbi:MAG: hypothetical protein GXP63_06910, partial [DPANN group archaeon]|nr:hypothetical protein [DPANN group archaeon]